MLEVVEASARYRMHNALRRVSLTVGRGEVVSVLGANGAGKSTLLKVIAGMHPAFEIGALSFAGCSLLGMAPHQRVDQGIAYVPDTRGVFGELTVRENLFLGALPKRARKGEREALERVLALFPRLAERLAQTVRTMSGGEQQMVAIGRALMSNPGILLLDEPSLGLSPLMVEELFRALTLIREEDVSILIVEQNARRSLELSDRGYLLEQGVVVGEDSAEELLGSEAVQKAYLGQ
jgi:branched-chain amino acid transport system ATP-binding protein